MMEQQYPFYPQARAFETQAEMTIEGMRVMFDEPVALQPVGLIVKKAPQKKATQETDANGR